MRLFDSGSISKFFRLGAWVESCHSERMPKRISTPRLDVVQSAHRVVQESIRNTEAADRVLSNPSLLSQVMAEMGRRGGQIGGKRRLVTLSVERRKEIASNAAKARWRTNKNKKK